MKEKRRPLVPMDDTLRGRGLALGVAGTILLFGAALAVIFTPSELLPLLLIPMSIGLALLIVAYVVMRKAERAVFEQGHAPHSSRLKP